MLRFGAKPKPEALVKRSKLDDELIQPDTLDVPSSTKPKGKFPWKKTLAAMGLFYLFGALDRAPYGQYSVVHYKGTAARQVRQPHKLFLNPPGISEASYYPTSTQNGQMSFHEVSRDGQEVECTLSFSWTLAEPDKLKTVDRELSQVSSADLEQTYFIFRSNSWPDATGVSVFGNLIHPLLQSTAKRYLNQHDATDLFSQPQRLLNENIWGDANDSSSLSGTLYENYGLLIETPQIHIAPVQDARYESL
jgi:hypothetical protein